MTNAPRVGLIVEAVHVSIGPGRLVVLQNTMDGVPEASATYRVPGRPEETTALQAGSLAGLVLEAIRWAEAVDQIDHTLTAAGGA